MIPDCRKRMEAALEDLKGTLVHIILVLVITVYLNVWFSVLWWTLLTTLAYSAFYVFTL
jgi:hypothetical protein